jgi:hypothetical protein
MHEKPAQREKEEDKPPLEANVDVGATDTNEDGKVIDSKALLKVLYMMTKIIPASF